MWAFWREAPRRRAFAEAGLKNFAFLAKWLAMAFLLESLRVAYVPNEAIGTIAGGDRRAAGGIDERNGRVTSRAG